MSSELFIHKQLLSNYFMVIATCVCDLLVVLTFFAVFINKAFTILSKILSIFNLLKKKTRTSTFGLTYLC
jgi:hypothetical protein